MVGAFLMADDVQDVRWKEFEELGEEGLAGRTLASNALLLIAS